MRTLWPLLPHREGRVWTRLTPNGKQVKLHRENYCRAIWGREKEREREREREREALRVSLDHYSNEVHSLSARPQISVVLWRLLPFPEGLNLHRKESCSITGIAGHPEVAAVAAISSMCSVSSPLHQGILAPSSLIPKGFFTITSRFSSHWVF